MSLEPSDTLLTLSLISTLISLAASALRCAKFLTSDATTAKPRPCSPALAASTAAFNASKFVWKAISSITPIMSAIRLDEALISRIALTASPTTFPPNSASLRALLAKLFALAALSAFCLTVAVN